MQPEIRRQLRKTDPERARRKLKRHLLESSRQEVVRLVHRNSQVCSSFRSSVRKNDPAVTETATRDASVDELHHQKTSVVTLGPAAV